MTIELDKDALSKGHKKGQIYPPSASNSNHSNNRKKFHSRTQSIATQPVTQKKKQSRRGSLPAIHVPASDGFGSPLRSPFVSSPTTRSMPFSEKLVSINIANPKSDVKGQYITRHENTIKNLSYIMMWYFFSTSLSLYNKNLMGRDRFNFNFPLLVSSIHAGLHFMITSIMMWFGGNRWNSSLSSSMSIYDYLFKVVPCGVAAAVEICCSNASLVYITLSFYTMVKSSTPIWVLIFSFLFGFEKPKFLLISIILIMVAGVILTVEGETKFDTLGFSLVLIASIVSGLRWSMTQLLLQHERLGIDNPIATLYYLSPIMFITMLTLSLILEHPLEQFQHSKHFDTISHVVESLGLMSIGGFLAFAMTLAELYLIKNTNTITLSVAGISKEIVIITLSVLIYGDVLTPKNLLG
ncbi:hypothetical protein RMATCC62417_08162 [Rhizopus microsporus]|nr:hypothetical protein RMATCC62417_08162 [Rhizopus microsporus]